MFPRGVYRSEYVPQRRTTVSSKKLVRATEDALERYRRIANKSPEDTPVVLGQLFTDAGNRTGGLRKWRLKQKSEIEDPAFEKVLDFLIRYKIVEVK